MDFFHCIYFSKISVFDHLWHFEKSPESKVYTMVNIGRSTVKQFLTTLSHLRLCPDGIHCNSSMREEASVALYMPVVQGELLLIWKSVLSALKKQTG